METEKRDWKKIVEDNKENTFFLPTELSEDAKAWQSGRVEFQKEVNRVAELENQVGLKFTNLIYAIRKKMSDEGFENIWTCDIGFNTEALKEGLFVLNITKGERNG